ncbi:[protein-PII] uridylyltransferase [Montanilutibacter psychrotolerans]|uniref:Bifunctional uridylyltransferase/uridylyl-removing enzyme n=1 Tax=Montanilutibacter psychrotolerans TaxID=1327343 RepID=A0A3M8SYA9_9GAMM|nr:[protein-PII] uridylyltransferase [Lysobacter psychrotolerans]RNF86398.1 [protein-PII] uridylyltransferase [Lysobacter psychrotolerans]
MTGPGAVVPAAGARAATGPGDATADAAWSAAARTSLAETAATLASRFDASAAAVLEAGSEPATDAGIDRLLTARAAAVDAQVRDAWLRCIPADAGLALFAVGGYGRAELFPQSDVDLLVLVPEAADTASDADGAASASPAHAEALARFFALLWDAGLPVGHAVRTPRQCTEAAADITVLTAMLEARPLLADASAVATLQAAASPDLVWPAHEFFVAKREELRARHARYGDTADNLEPNLKEGPGGLRDVQTLRWMALRIIGTGDFESLVALGQLGADELATMQRQRRALSTLRFGLHLVAGKREERLRFDHQKTLAARLGHVDNADNLAVEQMMQGFYRSAALVLRLGERLLQRFEEQLEGEAQPQPLGPRFELRRGYLAARPHDAAVGELPWPADADEVLALFAAWAKHGDPAGMTGPAIAGLHSQTARALAESLPTIPSFDTAAPALRERFMQLLRGPQPVATLTRMARLGVLGRWIPAFSNVSGRMQFDLFHVYTVDQHTLAVLKNLASFASGQADERFNLAHEVWPRLRKPELLLLAGLFHDIAKGRGGDHSELGAVDAREFCTAMGLSAGDTALVEWLVREHLLMSVTAQKQDIADPEVIHRFATRVADRERLDHLYLLTCADIAGTSPKLWNAWKDRLLADLYTATRLALRRGLENPLAATERSAETRAAAHAMLAAFGVSDEGIEALFARMPEIGFQRGRPDQVAWQAASLREVALGDTRVRARPVAAHAGAIEVFVHTPDRAGLFAAIVATLDRCGLAIQQARVLDGPHGMIFDSFEVIPTDPRSPPAPEEIERRLAQALAGPLDSVKPARRTQPRHLRHFRISPQVGFDVVDAGAAGARTMLSLVCTDRPGLLADVADVLRSQALSVHDARIATFGERAEDVFQITTTTDGRNQPLDATRQEALRDALLACLEGDNR